MNSKPQKSRRTLARRDGTTLVELAFALPIFFFIVISFCEFGRYLMVQHALNEAARVGCRDAVLAGRSKSDIESKALAILAPFGVTSHTVNCVPTDPATAAQWDLVTVRISVPYSNVSFFPTSSVLPGAQISSTVVLPKETST